MKLRVLAVLLAIVGLSLAAPTAFADPVGPGQWTPDSPGHSVQTCAGGQVNGMTFSLPGGNLAQDACGNGKQRAEFRYDNYAGGSGGNYSTGIRQFGGTFTINSMAGTRISLKQTFNGSTGPYFLMAVDNTGRLYSVENGKTISSNVKVGTPVQVNTVHNTSTHTLQVYINGSLAYTDTSAPGGDFYDKIGTYQTASGSGSINVTWSNVGFWHQ